MDFGLAASETSAKAKQLVLLNNKTKLTKIDNQEASASMHSPTIEIRLSVQLDLVSIHQISSEL